MSDDTVIADNTASPLDTDGVQQRLREQLERSERQLVGLESVLSDMQRGHDTLQEDRDGTTVVVNSVRGDVLQIRRALARLADGTYGRCLACGATIVPERLEAIPTVARCARCARG